MPFNWMRKRCGSERLMGSRVVILMLLSALCSCTLPGKKVTRAKTDLSRHHSVVRATSHHKLSEAEKNKLFEDFQRWRVANGQVEPRASSLVEDDQPLEPR
jgi:hypothetical protein